MAKPIDTKGTLAPANEQLRLPFWGTTFRAMPNDFSRSALFTVKHKRIKRAAMQGVILFHYNNDVTIEFTGIELRAYDDELVWQQVLDYAKEYPLGSEIRFTFYQLCNDLGMTPSKGSYQRIEDCLSRLKANSLNFRSNRLHQLEAFSLLDKFKIDMIGKRRGDIVVAIDPVILQLFNGNQYTKLVWDQYRAISPIARRLYDYLASHREPYPLQLETFRQMCGSDCMVPRKWRDMTKAACEELVKTNLVKWAKVTSDKVMGSRNSNSEDDTNAIEHESVTQPDNNADPSNATGQLSFYDEVAEIDKGLDELEAKFKDRGRS